MRSQSINKSSDSDGTFQHYLSLTKHHSSTTQKEAILFLQQHANEHVANMGPLFSAVSPLILDQSKIVRDAVLELFKSRDVYENLQYHIDFIILYIHSAMTHITPEIRSQSTQFLDVLLEAAPKAVCRTAWAKTLSCFFPLLGWKLDNESGMKPGRQSSTMSSSSVASNLSLGSGNIKSRFGHLQSLNKIITIGIDGSLDEDNSRIMFHPDTSRLVITNSSNPYMALNLYETSISASSSSSITEDSRSRIEFIKVYWNSLVVGLQDSIKESGQIGRTAKALLVFLEQRLLSR